MTVISLLIVLLVLGLLAYGVSRAPFIAPTFKTIAYWVLVVIAFLFVLSAFGVLGSLNMRVPNVGGG